MNPAPKLPPTERDRACTYWDGGTLALELYAVLAERFRDTEFILALHGSVPRVAMGNDLDLIAAQWNDVGCSADALLDRVKSRMVGPILEMQNIFLVSLESVSGRRFSAKLYHQTIGNERRIIDLLIVLL